MDQVEPQNNETLQNPDAIATPTNGAAADEYGADKIKVLEGLEAVRKRPAMYIGSTGPTGLHHLVYEVVDNSIDEALAGFCDQVNVTIHIDNSVTVVDNGRGIPVDMHETGKSAAEVVLTVLHAGGKFENDAYKVSGGLHGVGVSVVNALSETLDLEIWRDGRSTSKATSAASRPPSSWSPERPSVAAPRSASSPTRRSSRRLRSASTRSPTAFASSPSSTVASSSLSTMSARRKGAGGQRQEPPVPLRGRHPRVRRAPEQEQGGRERRADLHAGRRRTASTSRSRCSGTTATRKRSTPSRTTSTRTKVASHLSGFRAALTRTINAYATEHSLAKDLKESISGDDIREGLVAIISVKIPQPQFEGQTKTKLGNTEVKGIVEQIVNDRLGAFLEENPVSHGG